MVAPSSVALSLRRMSCSPVAPDKACTLDMDLSKSIVAFRIAAPIPRIGIVTPTLREVPIWVMLFPILFKSLLTLCACLEYLVRPS